MKSHIIKIVMGLFFTGLLVSCASNSSTKLVGNKNVISQERKITSSFNRISVSDGIQLYLTMDEKKSIRIEADENIQKHIKTKIKNGVLEIYLDQPITSFNSKKVYVSTPNIHLLNAFSGSRIISKNVLTTEHLQVFSSSGSNIKLSIDTNYLLAKATHGSSMEFSGVASNFNSASSNGSYIKSYNLKSSNAIAKASSGGNIKLFVEDELTAKASSGGNIKYKGTPKLVNKKTSSGGSVS